MAKERKFMVFRALFYLKCMSNQDILQAEALAGVLLEERKLHISK